MPNEEPATATGRSGRRPGVGGSREAILSAASRQFARRGYTYASLRAIAADAGVDQKLIAYSSARSSSCSSPRSCCR
jgi:hypothetical protein